VGRVVWYGVVSWEVEEWIFVGILWGGGEGGGGLRWVFLGGSEDGLGGVRYVVLVIQVRRLRVV